MHSELTSIIKRISTGIEGLDRLIEGGIPKESITLVSGPPGSGKSIFCFHFLNEGVKSGEKGLFMTLDKKVDGLLIQSKKLGFDFQKAIEEKKVKFMFLNINKKLVYETMTNEILSGEYDRIVLDSITPLSELPIYITNVEEKNDREIINPTSDSPPAQLPVRRLHLQYIMHTLENSKSTSVITSELPAGTTLLSRDGLSEFLADAVIKLSLDPTMDRRKLSIVKMRNTKHTLRPQDIEIGDNGISFS